MPRMFVQRINWANKEIKRFYELTKQYYNVDDSKGYFLDLGANIGTTGIYFLKKFTPNLKLLAFEPDPTNFKLHRLNLILNDMESMATVVNYGLGNESIDLPLQRSLTNPGGNSIVRKDIKGLTEIIKVIPLDIYIAKNKIDAQEVKYIWIDTEGFEAQVLLGSKDLLKVNPLPIFMEFNLKAWDNSGCFEDMMTLLAESYSHFIHMYRGKEVLYPLETLRTFERPNNPLGQIGDIFLIKKGTIA
ncbi:MAG: FkbM family methyltransferase [Selenomonadaceae bacterium]|nr:FkbM family methyltransferase [Selenomonadaceae bacterium]